MNIMKIAVYLPDTTPYSMKHCAWNIMAILQEKYKIQFITFKTLSELPIVDADIYWDPRCGGGIAPALVFRKTRKPLVLTVHGMAMFTLPLDAFYFSWKQKIVGQIKRWKERLKWKLMQKHIAHVMTVSEYTKSELTSSVSFPKKKVTAVWNGIDHNKFKPSEKKQDTIPYFLTVISYQKKKNFERLLEAYQLLDEETRPKLIAIVKPYEPTAAIKKIKGLEIINYAISEERIIELYQQAMALVFVSLHEGFGLPIAEAMACGVPVVTSNSTSCKEIAGDAAFLVNPTSTEEIKNALSKIANDAMLRQQFSEKGIARAQQFNWEKTADGFYKIINSIINKY
ncbi:MAG: glycosyltransferase family 4 protein [Bacteroidetes bacterium]|nr:glycosyltransferase family 4 protein [Bacteroidota bacterium]